MPIGRRAKNLLAPRRSTELDGCARNSGEARERREVSDSIGRLGFGREACLPVADHGPAHRRRSRLEQEERDRVLLNRAAGPAVAGASKLDAATETGPRPARRDSGRRPDDRGDAADASRGERRQRASQPKGKSNLGGWCGRQRVDERGGRAESGAAALGAAPEFKVRRRGTRQRSQQEVDLVPMERRRAPYRVASGQERVGELNQRHRQKVRPPRARMNRGQGRGRRPGRQIDAAALDDWGGVGPNAGGRPERNRAEQRFDGHWIASGRRNSSAALIPPNPALTTSADVPPSGRAVPITAGIRARASSSLRFATGGRTRWRRVSAQMATSNAPAAPSV